MGRTFLPVSVAAILSVAVFAVAQDTPATRLSLKGLEGVAVRLEPVASPAQRDGLSAEVLRTAVESQLSRAGIRVLSVEHQQQLPRRPALEVSVATIKLGSGEQLYSIHVEVTQWVASLANPEVPVTAAVPMPARTWSAPSVFGITPADQLSREVQGAVRRMVDEFVDAYFKANPSETAFRARRDAGLR